jgi:hypothetical protein
VKLAVDLPLFAVIVREFEGRPLEGNVRDTDGLRALYSKDNRPELLSALEELHAPLPPAGVSPIHSAGDRHVDDGGLKNWQRERHAGSGQEEISG